MADNKKIAEQVLAAVGGKENVTNVTHCMTRLRFTLKDNSIPNQEEIKGLDGVIGVVVAGGQFQVIVGQNVPKVYDEVCKIGGFAVQDAIDENLDGPKEKLTLKGVGKNIMNYLAGTMTQLIPIMIAAAMFKTVSVLFGPDILGWISADSDLYILMEALYNAGFYFMPIYIGYAAAKRLGVSPMLGLYMGGILVAPGILSVVAAGEPFTVYGLPMRLVDYTQSVMPILICVWLLSYVEKFFKRVIPDTLSTIFVPFLTMVVMVPVALCAAAPVGSFLGDIIGGGLNALAAKGGIIPIVLIAALWEFLVMTGMHTVVLIPGIMNLLMGNPDSCVMVAGGMATWAAFGMALGAFFKLKDKKEKALAGGYFVSGFVGGVTEPVLYGIGMKYKRPFICLAIGGALGGLYCGITHVTVYLLGATNFLSVLGYVAGGTANLVNSVVASLIAMLGTAVLTYFFGFDKNEPATK